MALCLSCGVAGAFAEPGTRSLNPWLYTSAAGGVGLLRSEETSVIGASVPSLLSHPAPLLPEAMSHVPSLWWTCSSANTQPVWGQLWNASRG